MEFGVVFTFFCFLVVLGFFVMMILISKKIIHAPRFVRFCDGFLKVALTAFGLWVVVVFAGLGYKDADNNGWFPHKRTVTVLMSHDWIAGEFKKCTLSPEAVLTCDVERVGPHTMEVEFRGSVDSTGAYKQDIWNCQRKQESIVCKGDSGEAQATGWSRNKTVERWFVRDPVTRLSEERKYTLSQALDFCKQNLGMEIATQSNASANAFSTCPAFLDEFGIPH